MPHTLFIDKWKAKHHLTYEIFLYQCVDKRHIERLVEVELEPLLSFNDPPDVEGTLQRL